MMIPSYFASEKKAAFVACTIGLVACTCGFYFLIGAMPPFYTGLAIPLVILGIIQVVTGAFIARRSDMQAYDLQKMLGEDPDEFVSLESPRMGKVMRNFVLLRWVEGAIIVVGIALVLFSTGLVFTMGLGLGLCFEGIMMLVFDYFAEKRGEKYATFVDGVLGQPE